VAGAGQAVDDGVDIKLCEAIGSSIHQQIVHLTRTRYLI
jgi:hypothetical protein